MENKDLHIVKEELYDPDVMEALLRDVDSYPKSELIKLKFYKKSRKQGNLVEVVYHYGKGCDDNHIGRLYVKNNKGLQAFPHDIRNPLLEKFYWDIDFEASHHYIMKKLADDWGLIVDTIKYYCNNRNECLYSISNDRRIAKTEILKITYGGNIKLHNEYIKDDYGEIKPNEFLINLKKETENLMNMCYMKYPQFHDFIKKKIKSKTDLLYNKNPKSSLFALILQTEERKCLLALDNYLKSINRQADILIHDGLEVRKLPNEVKFPIDILRNGEKAILDETGYTIKLVQKPYEHNFVFKENPHIVIDDIYAAKKFIEILDNNIVNDNGLIYFFNEENGMWNNDDITYRQLIIKNKDKLIFYDFITDKKINYAGSEYYISAIKKWLPALVEQTDFITNNLDTAIGKLLFNDGYYDFKTKTFNNNFDRNIIFLKKINRNYPIDRDKDLIKKVNDILFVKAFDYNNSLDIGEYFKKSLCMALFGDYYRKKVYFAIGNTNSGKGVLVNAFSSAFGSYIHEFDANNLLYNNNSQDEAKKLAWIKSLNGCRIAFSSECRMNDTKIDGNLLKKLSSGGDVLNIRGNHQDEYKFINRSSLFLLMNDCQTITPIDTGITNRVRYLNYLLSFVDNPQNEYERLVDPYIKTNFQKEEYKNALLYLMIDTYNGLTDDESKLNGYIKEPINVLNETKSWIKDENTIFLEKLNEKFEITNNESDYVETRKVIDYILNDCKLNMSETKIGKMLTKLISFGRLEKVVKNKKCRLGIKEITNKLDFD
jgi:hypothetical protein